MSIVGMAQAQPRAHVTAIESFYKGPMARLTASSDTDQLEVGPGMRFNGLWLAGVEPSSSPA